MNCEILYFMLTLSLPPLYRGYMDVSTTDPEKHGTPNPAGELSSVYFSGERHRTKTRDGALSFRFNEEPGTALQDLMDDKIKNMEPLVQCSDSHMTLKIKKTRAPHFFVDSREGQLIPVSQVPPGCGFSIQRSHKDVHFSAPYQGCHVTQQGGNYVLPLNLWGIPMTMTCPVITMKPSVSCFMHGMVVNVGGVTENELQVKVSGRWMPLSAISNSCGIAVKMLAGGLTLATSYHKNSCIQLKDEVFYLLLLLEDVELSVTCPVRTNSKPVTETSAPPSDGGQLLQFSQGPQFPTPSPYLVFPATGDQTKSPHVETDVGVPQPRIGSSVQTHTPAEPAPSPAHLLAISEYVKVPKHFLMPQITPFHEYLKTMTAVSTAQRQDKSHLNRSQHFPQNIQDVHSSPHPNPPAVLIEAAQVKHDEKPNFPLNTEFPQQIQYNLSISTKYLPYSQLQYPKHLNQDIRPHVVSPKSFRIPVSYPYLDNPPQEQRSQYPTAAPTLTTTTSATTTQRPQAYNLLHHRQNHKPAYHNSKQGLPLALSQSRISPLKNTSTISESHPPNHPQLLSMHHLPFTPRSRNRHFTGSYQKDHRLP